jgi:hypothetical protein
VGLSALLDGVGRFLGLEPVFTVGISVLLALLPFWLLWWGFDLLRRLPRTAGDARAS